MRALHGIWQRSAGFFFSGRYQGHPLPVWRQLGYRYDHSGGKLTDNPKLLLNYDKINNNLYITSDRQTIIQLDKESIANFTLRGNGEEYYFKRVNLMNSMKFFQIFGG